MKDPTKGRKPGRNREQPEKQVWLSAAEFAKCIEMTARAVRNSCKAGLYPGSRLASMNGGEGWQIPLECLPVAAQAEWHRAQAKAKPRRVTQQDNISQDAPQLEKANNVTIDQAFKEALWERYEKATKGQKERAERSFAIAKACQALELEGKDQPQILQALGEQFDSGTSKATVWRIRQTVKGQDEGIWLPLLLPEWKGKTHSAPFSEAAWEHIKDDWGRQSQPSLKAVYRRAKKIAHEKGWEIPSYDTVKARVDAIPHDQKVWMREGDKALARLFPAQKRIFSTLQLHEIWCADGHKADVWVKDETGEIFRPIVMGWMDIRSRVLLGYAVAKSETADLVRHALHQAITRSKAVPREALLDNGRAFASKEISGGVPNRYRFKVKENEALGTLPLLGVGVIWATPGHGQAKPIERFWGHLTEMAKQFDKAYCGKDTKSKPENFNAKNAIPLAEFKHALKETIADYHTRAHRGNGMEGNKSPHQIYEELAQVTPIRQPTAAQIRLCLMTAEAVRLKGDEGAIFINGNRYWSVKISGLSRGKTYTARYNPEDSQQPVSLYLDERYICDVPIIGAVAFRNRDEAKAHAGKRRAYVKSVKQADDALAELRKSESGVFRTEIEGPDPDTTAMTRPKIAVPVRLPLQIPPAASSVEEEEDTPLMGPDEFAELWAKKFSQQGK